MQTECCLRLVHFFLYNLKPPRWLLYNIATVSVFPNGLTLFFSILCIKLSLCIYQFTFAVDTTERMSILLLSSPSFYGDCDDDDDDEPISTYISLFFCFYFATRHYNIMGLKKEEKKLKSPLHSEALLYSVASLKNDRL